jgi:hypothetical protein
MIEGKKENNKKVMSGKKMKGIILPERLNLHMS